MSKDTGILSCSPPICVTYLLGYLYSYLKKKNQHILNNLAPFFPGGKHGYPQLSSPQDFFFVVVLHEPICIYVYIHAYVILPLYSVMYCLTILYFLLCAIFK